MRAVLQSQRTSSPFTYLPDLVPPTLTPCRGGKGLQQGLPVPIGGAKIVPSRVCARHSGAGRSTRQNQVVLDWIEPGYWKATMGHPAERSTACRKPIVPSPPGD